MLDLRLPLRICFCTENKIADKCKIFEDLQKSEDKCSYEIQFNPVKDARFLIIAPHGG